MAKNIKNILFCKPDISGIVDIYVELNENGDLLYNNEYYFKHIITVNQQGKTIHRTYTVVSNIRVLEFMTIPFSIFEKINTYFIVDIVLPEDYILPNGGKMRQFYEPEGFAHPEFNNFEDAVYFVKNFGFDIDLYN